MIVLCPKCIDVCDPHCKLCGGSGSYDDPFADYNTYYNDDLDDEGEPQS